MSKGNVNIRKIPLNSRKITVTDYKKFLGPYLKNQNCAAFTQCSRVPGILTHIHTHVAECLFVADNARDAVLLYVSASSGRQNREMKQGQ